METKELQKDVRDFCKVAIKFKLSCISDKIESANKADSILSGA